MWLERTAKSCGPDVAVLALSPRETKLLAGDGGKRAVLRGEHEASRKAIAQGRPGCFRRTCMLVCIFCQSANGMRDRGCGTHPVFPAPSDRRGQTKFKTSGRACRENAASCSVVIPAHAGIQYSEATMIEPKSRGVLDPRLRGDDSEI